MHGANLYKIIEKISNYQLFIFPFCDKKIDLKRGSKSIFSNLNATGGFINRISSSRKTYKRGSRSGKPAYLRRSSGKPAST